MDKRILIIEDETLIQDMYRIVLTQKGYIVVVASDGEEALEKVVSNDTFDLILLDIMLPKTNGLEVLKSLKAPESKAKDTPVWILTNLDQKDVMDEAKQLGAVKCLVKSRYLPSEIVTEITDFFTQQETS